MPAEEKLIKSPLTLTDGSDLQILGVQEGTAPIWHIQKLSPLQTKWEVQISNTAPPPLDLELGS